MADGFRLMGETASEPLASTGVVPGLGACHLLEDEVSEGERCVLEDDYQKR